jgi:hypothetical protein
MMTRATTFEMFLALAHHLSWLIVSNIHDRVDGGPFLSAEPELHGGCPPRVDHDRLDLSVRQPAGKSTLNSNGTILWSSVRETLSAAARIVVSQGRLGDLIHMCGWTSAKEALQ